MTISDIAVTLTGEQMMTKYTGGHERPSRDDRCVPAPEPTIVEARPILYQRRPRLEPNYSLALPDEALETALRLW